MDRGAARGLRGRDAYRRSGTGLAVYFPISLLFCFGFARSGWLGRSMSASGTRTSSPPSRPRGIFEPARGDGGNVHAICRPCVEPSMVEIVDVERDWRVEVALESAQ